MLGTVGDGLVLLGPEVAAEIELGDHASRAELVGAHLAGETASSPRSADDPLASEVEALTDQLAELGALRPSRPGRTGTPLSTALRHGEVPAGAIFTAEELLVLAPSLSPAERRRALDLFVAGLSPHGRLAAYVQLAQGRGAVWGDLPDPDELDRGLQRAERLGADIGVVELSSHGQAWSVRREELEAIGAARPHRLGPIVRLGPFIRLLDHAAEPVLCVAELAHPDLGTAVPPPVSRLAQGVGAPEHAQLVALAEGAERTALLTPGTVETVRARRTELRGAIAPSTLFAGASATGPDADDGARLWIRATAHDGADRWVPAETVLLTSTDPHRLPWTSSGAAAHRDAAQARSRAFCELVERDAFVWTWMQRVSRERVRPASVPGAATRWRETLAHRGWTTTWVNLTLDSFPVILCALTHPDRGLTVATACHPEPAVALEHATREAAVTALLVPNGGAGPPAPERVHSPHDHLMLHRDPARRPDHSFLFEGAQEIDLTELAPRYGEDLESALAELGHLPLHVDLSRRRWAPFHVV
ncbi:MAG: YcaO-like family protein, partial [Solirubrobacterales bacterium]|nr:YcaO-like family protein [Solirubrobacterales bacterium]